jgi:HTH-type transcriptional regulator/antitoxin MqsA
MFDLEEKMSDKELCPICGAGHVTDHVEHRETEYKGHTAMVPLHYQVCDACHSDFAGIKEGKLNKRGIMAFRKSVDGLLTGEEIRALRSKYKLTQEQAARLFGGGPVAFSKYENDDVAQSESMDTLLRMVRRSDAVFWELLAEKGMVEEFTHEKRVGELSASSSAKIYPFPGRQQVAAELVSKTTWTAYEPEDRKWK